MNEFDEVTAFPLEDHEANFEADATLTTVPLGMAICRFATLLSAIDYHLYHTGKIDMIDARMKIQWAAELMDKKFDLPYNKLPQ